MMTTSKTSQLVRELMMADDEKVVVQLLSNGGYWEDDSAWLPYGGNENNQSIIGSQQSDAFAALTEKIINSVDAYLIMACLLSGIDPESDKAPENMDEAIRRYGHIFTGHSVGMRVREAYEKGVDQRELTELARKIAVVVTGEKSQPPCMTIIDQATGQAPDDFKNTFLSLVSGNKVRVRFVQGKFNMGGSGALRFCSEEHNLQLFVSRRNPALLSASASDRDKMWGMTIVRRRPARVGERMSVYEYLAPKDVNGNNSILAFPSKSLAILPSENLRTPCSVEADWGTFNKLYQYRWPQSLASYSTQIQGKSTVMHLNINLPDAVMPIRVYELRGFQAANPTMNVYGIRARFEQTTEVRNRLEPEVPIAGQILVGGFALPVRAYVFKFDDDRMTTYRGEYGVIFSLNGQKHGHLSETFFARKEVDLGVLRTKTVVVVDCDSLDTHAREQILMNSRDRLAESQTTNELRQQLAAWLKENEVLSLLKRRHIEAQLEKTLGEDKPLAELLKKMVSENPDLASIFKHGSRIPGGRGLGDGGSGPSTFNGKDEPTFFRFDNHEPLLEKRSPINHAMNLQFETDVVNDFFTRAGALSPGSFAIETLHPLGIDVSGVIGTLHDGSISVRLKHPAGSQVGEKYEVSLVIAAPDSDKKFINSLKVEVLPVAESQKPGGRGEKTSPNSGDKGGASQAGIDLPRIIPIYKEDWASHDWNEWTALEVQMLNDKPEAFQINMDNCYLDQARRKKPKSAHLLERRFQFGLSFLAIAVITNIDEVRKQLPDDATSNLSVEDIVRLSMTAIAQSVLPVIDVLGRLTESEMGDMAVDE